MPHTAVRYNGTAVVSYHSYIAEELAAKFCRLTTAASGYSLAVHTNTVGRGYDPMTSAKGGTYAGQYPFDGWIDDLEPTPQHATSRKRHLSVQARSSFCELSSTTFHSFGSGFFSTKVEPFSAL